VYPGIDEYDIAGFHAVFVVRYGRGIGRDQQGHLYALERFFIRFFYERGWVAVDWIPEYSTITGYPVLPIFLKRIDPAIVPHPGIAQAVVPVAECVEFVMVDIVEDFEQARGSSREILQVVLPVIPLSGHCILR